MYHEHEHGQSARRNWEQLAVLGQDFAKSARTFGMLKFCSSNLKFMV